jgi:integrase
LKLEFQGRKRHRRSYYTFVGKDSIEHLKMWKEKEAEQIGRAVDPDDYVFMGRGGMLFEDAWLNYRLKVTAGQLFNQRLIVNGDRRSWRSHLLRHSFETEASHAQVKAEIRDYFMGHIGGIQWIYNHRDEVHPEELLQEYVKIEPHVSLNASEITLRQEFEGTNKQMLRIIMDLQKKVSRLEAQSEPSSAPAPVGSRSAPTSGP